MFTPNRKRFRYLGVDTTIKLSEDPDVVYCLLLHTESCVCAVQWECPLCVINDTCYNNYY